MDFDYLEQFITFQDTNFDITTLNIIAFSKYGKKKVRDLYLSNIHRIDTFMYKSCYVIPDIIVEELLKNPKKKVDLKMSCTSWEHCLLALQVVADYNIEIAERIFFDNINDIQKAISLPQATYLDHAINFLEFIENTFPKSKNKLFKNINLNIIRINWEKRLNGSKLEKDTASKLIKMAIKTKLPIKKVAQTLLKNYEIEII